MSAVLPDLRLMDAVRYARRRDASDLHLCAGTTPVVRIDGELQPAGGSALKCDEVRAIMTRLLGAEALESVESGKDVSAAWIDDEAGPMRVHGFRFTGGLAIAIRLLGLGVPRLETLGLPEVVDSLCNRERGLILFAGPTGSGKSTSLAAVVDRINASFARRIVTIEDPVEYRHVNKHSVITQREIGRDTVSCSDAITGALRADPDVIMVGEMRDVATMQAALVAAETGHLVLATLHTGDAVETIDRIVDAFSGAERGQVRAQLSQVLTAVVCQHLVRRAGGSGRRAVTEVLLATDAVRSIIREARSHQLRNVMATGRALGMHTLEQHLAELLAAREIDAECARFVGRRMEEVRSYAEPMA